MCNRFYIGLAGLGRQGPGPKPIHLASRPNPNRSQQNNNSHKSIRSPLRGGGRRGTNNPYLGKSRNIFSSFKFWRILCKSYAPISRTIKKNRKEKKGVIQNTPVSQSCVYPKLYYILFFSDQYLMQPYLPITACWNKKNVALARFRFWIFNPTMSTSQVWRICVAAD